MAGGVSSCDSCARRFPSRGSCSRRETQPRSVRHRREFQGSPSTEEPSARRRPPSPHRRREGEELSSASSDADSLTGSFFHSTEKPFELHPFSAYIRIRVLSVPGAGDLAPLRCFRTCDTPVTAVA